MWCSIGFLQCTPFHIYFASDRTSGYTTFFVFLFELSSNTKTFPGWVARDRATSNCPCAKHDEERSIPSLEGTDCPWDLLIVIAKHTRIGNWRLLNPVIAKPSIPGMQFILGSTKEFPLKVPDTAWRNNKFFVMFITTYRVPFTCPRFSLILHKSKTTKPF